jgi:hypothetical protein
MIRVRCRLSGGDRLLVWGRRDDLQHRKQKLACHAYGESVCIIMRREQGPPVGPSSWSTRCARQNSSSQIARGEHVCRIAPQNSVTHDLGGFWRHASGQPQRLPAHRGLHRTRTVTSGRTYAGPNHESPIITPLANNMKDRIVGCTHKQWKGCICQGHELTIRSDAFSCKVLGKRGEDARSMPR